jgi:NAD-dependent dihydropyrimidine dehydrogenase PreA subunit
MEGRALHYVCTRDEATRVIDRHTRFWVSNCGCRELRGNCIRSRIDVCLQFREKTAASDSGLREITRADVADILREAETRHLVTRPFRNEQKMEETDGICFCCDDCCGYFTDPGGYICDRGAQIEHTDLDACTDCGECAKVCYFGARKMSGGTLVLHRDDCYGCALCTDVCPETCIEMAARK